MEKFLSIMDSTTFLVVLFIIGIVVIIVMTMVVLNIYDSFKLKRLKRLEERLDAIEFLVERPILLEGIKESARKELLDNMKRWDEKMQKQEMEEKKQEKKYNRDKPKK